MRFLKFICIIFMLGMLMPQGVFAQSKNLFGKVYMMTKNGKTGIYNKEHKKWYMEQIYDSIVGVGATYYCFEYSLDYDYAGYSNGSITLAECPGSKNPITNLQDYEYLGEGKSCHGLALKRNNKWAWIPGSKTSSVADAETISYEFDSLAPFKPLNPISLDHFLIGYKNGYMNLYDDYTKDKLIDAEQIISVSPIFSPFFNTWEGKADAIMIKNTANLLGITVLGPRHYIKPTTLAPQYHRIEIDTLKSYMYCTNLDKNVLDVYSFLLRVGSSMKFTREYTTTADGINSFFAFKEEQAQQEQLKKAIQDSIETKNKIRMGEERKASATNLRLGDFIDALALLDPAAPLVVDKGGSIGRFNSYRGYYEDLAAVPTDKPHTVGEVLALAREACGAVLEGYKGGDYPMHRKTLLWLSEYGCSSGTMIVGVTATAETVLVETAQQPE